jgi:hypothetical protein
MAVQRDQPPRCAGTRLLLGSAAQDKQVYERAAEEDQEGPGENAGERDSWVKEQRNMR